MTIAQTVPEMRILTVRQPWAHAIVHLGKDVENRVQNIAGDYRGTIAIHVALKADSIDNHPSADALAAAHAHHASRAKRHPLPAPQPADHDDTGRQNRGHIIGVVNLWAVHVARPGCCPNRGVPPFGGPWALADHWHLNLSNPRALDNPIPWTGGLGLRRLPDHIARQVTQETTP